MRKLWTALAALIALSLAGCGYNTLQSNDEQIKASWSEVVSQYQRRADLVPNLVNTVKGFAAHEKEVLLGVTNARAKVGSIQATPDLINSPEAFARFQAAQGELSGALSSLTVSLPASTSTAARTAMKPAGDCLSDEEAQGWNRVGHMPLRPSGGREGRNLGVRKAFLVERGFFWSRHG